MTKLINGIAYSGFQRSSVSPFNHSLNAGLFKIEIETPQNYTNVIVFDTLTSNTDSSKYMYNTSDGTLTMLEDLDADVVLKFTVTNSETITDPDYRLGLRVDEAIIPPTFINTFANGSTDYEFKIAFRHIVGQEYQFVEFIPDPETFINTTTTISAGATLILQNIQVVGIEDGVFNFVVGDFNGSNLIIEHNFASRHIIAKFLNNTTNVVKTFDYTVLDSSRIQINETPFNGQAIILGI